MKKILFLSEAYPQSKNPKSSGNLNVFYTMLPFCEDKRYQCSFLHLKFNTQEKSKITKIKKKYFIDLGFINFINKLNLKNIIYYKGNQHSQDLENFINLEEYDYIFSIWSEFGASLISQKKLKSFATIGDIYRYQHVRWCKNIFLDFNILSIKKIKIYIGAFLKLLFLNFATKNLIKNLNGISMVNKRNYNYFKKIRKNNIFYTPNMWVYKNHKTIKKKFKKLKIVISMGPLNRTGNKFSIFYFFKKFYPILKKNIISQNFEIHIFGDKNIPISLLKYIDEKIKIRGYVKNIDKELKSAFILLNLNSQDKNFTISNTRILHCWSLGLNVITHINQKTAMPELINRKNILLGSDDLSLVKNINNLISHENFRKTLANNALKTLKSKYNAKKNAILIKKKFEKTFNIK